jgi:hypothetical protein
MLEFFRRYQKFFFLLVTAIVSASFLFFGAFDTLMNTSEQEEAVVGRAIDGSEIRSSDLRALTRFLASDVYDVGRSPSSSFNLFNDGVVRNDLIATGVAETLVRKGLPLLKGELEKKMERVGSFRPYEHPGAPFLSAQAVWEQAAPALNRERSLLQSKAECDGDVFAHLACLYQYQAALPPEWLRRVLLLQEQQYKWLQPDLSLRQRDLSLFGFHSLSDWFGNRFLELMAEFVYNASIVAEQKNYEVTLSEAKSDLRRRFAESLQSFQSESTPLQLTYREQLHLLGMDETQAAKIWRQVLLFRRYFHDMGSSAFIDRLPYAEFAAVATEKAKIELYRCPSCFQFRSALDLFTFQTYLAKVAALDPTQPLQLPQTLLPVKTVEKEAPELVYVDYTARVSVVDKREVGLRAPIQDLWKFETTDKVWGQLKREFPFLPKNGHQKIEERFSALEALGNVERTKVDLFARRLWVDAHPEWIDEALDRAIGEEKHLSLSAGAIAYPHIEDPKRLGALFEQVLKVPEEALSALQHFHSKEAVFRFENIAKVSDQKIKTFEEALKDGSLHRVRDRALQNAKQAGSPEQVAELLLKDLKKAILERSSEEGIPFTARRFEKMADAARKALEQNREDPRWIQTQGDDPLVAQFKLERIEKEISRSAKEDWISKLAFSLPLNQGSPIHLAEGDTFFFYLKEKRASEAPILENLMRGKEGLAADVHRILAGKIFDAMQPMASPEVGQK